MTVPLTDDQLERLILALTDCTHAVVDLQIAVLTLASQLTYRDVMKDSDHRPIEERDRPLRTVQRDAD